MDNITQILLVEGNDDFHLIRNICCNFNVNETFKVEDCKGINNILDGLPVRFKGSGEITTIGVIVDADVDIQSRWLKIRQILIDSNLYKDIPEDCPLSGLIINPIDTEAIKIGVWIMPDNSNNGMLEDFAAFLIPENDNLLPVADAILSDIEERKLNKYTLSHHSKARIHTWLAWQEDPGTPMGLAITKKYLTTTPHVCQAFVDWLNNLFN